MKFMFVIIAVCIFIEKTSGNSSESVENHDKNVNSSSSSENDSLSSEHNQGVAENQLAMQIFAILDHFKQEDPVGIPGTPIQDPMKFPNIRKSLGMATLNMKNVTAYGTSKFRVKHITTDLKNMMVKAGVQVDTITVLGSYTLTPLFGSTAEGPFTIQLKNVNVVGNASLGVERNGKLKTQDISLDIVFSDMSTDFQNLGFLGALFQNVINAAPTLVFDSMKPFILSEAYTTIRKEADAKIKETFKDHSFSNSISPLDMAIAEARKTVRTMGYDPYNVPNYNRTVGMFSVESINTWVTGLSSFYRVGDVTISMKNNVVSMKLDVGTQQIDGSTQWEISVGKGIMTRAGQAQFSIQHFKVSVDVSQALDTRQRPKINDIQLELGNIQVRCDGAGTIDYILEFVINVLPNLLRYQIMDAIENPVKQRIQEKFDQIDIEKTIKNNWKNIEKLANKELSFDFKL